LKTFLNSVITGSSESDCLSGQRCMAPPVTAMWGATVGVLGKGPGSPQGSHALQALHEDSSVYP